MPKVRAGIAASRRTREANMHPHGKSGPRISDDSASLVDLLAQQRQRWQKGERPSVEAFLEQTPALANNVDALLDLIGNEMLLRQEAGDRPQLAEYVNRFPKLAAPIEIQFEVELALAADSTADSRVSASNEENSRSDASTISGRSGAPLAPPTSLLGCDILEELGRGGQSVVYKAHQRGLDRFVALKLLRGNDADGDERARFQREAAAVARLKHPHIVQIHDFGADNGQLYCILEYVAGGTLAAKLGRLPQPPQEAVRLAETLARTMHWAHQQGIVHRDLKPSNVLLMEDGTPKIADFGLARRIGADVELTHSGLIMGTPSYMAPEQASGKSREAGPAADVYALGAILYEMLTGRPPFLGTTPWDVLPQVLELDPVPPRKLQPKVPADTETICLKCLAKDPQRRYASAEELAEDLRRTQAGEPIRARPVSAWERTWRWGRRRPAVAGLLSALILLAVGSIVSLTVLFLDAKRKEEGARAVTTFFEKNVLAVARPKGQEGGAGHAVTLKETLDHAAEKIDAAFIGHPEREASVRNTIGMTYYYLGFFDPATDPHLEWAYRLRNEFLGPDDLETLDSQHNLALQRSKQDEFAESIALASQALGKRRRLLGADHHDTLWTQLVLGYALRKNRQTEEAAGVLFPAIAACQRSLGPDHPLTLTGQFDLAAILWDQGKMSESAALKRTVLEGRRRTLGTEHPDTLCSQGNLGVALVDLGQLAEGEALCRETWLARKRVLGSVHRETLWSQSYLAVALHRSNHLDEAERLESDFLRTRRLQSGPTHPDVLDSMAFLSEILIDAGRAAEAEPLLQECLERRGNTPERGGYWHTVAARSLLGQAFVQSKRLAEAEPLLLAGFDDLFRCSGVPDRELDRAVDRIVAFYERRDRRDEAETWRGKRSRRPDMQSR